MFMRRPRLVRTPESAVDRFAGGSHQPRLAVTKSESGNPICRIRSAENTTMISSPGTDPSFISGAFGMPATIQPAGGKVDPQSDRDINRVRVRDPGAAGRCQADGELLPQCLHIHHRRAEPAAPAILARHRSSCSPALIEEPCRWPRTPWRSTSLPA